MMMGIVIIAQWTNHALQVINAVNVFIRNRKEDENGRNNGLYFKNNNENRQTV